MARKPRRDFEGAWHHVYNRGARRKLIFKSESDYIIFQKTLCETVDRFELEVHTYSLMPNHYHLFARSVLQNLSKAMQYLDSTYTQRFNAKYGYDGPLLRGRFANQIVGDRKYQRYLTAYIHLNPVVANLVKHPSEHYWTGHRIYLGLEDSPTWLTTDYLLNLFGSSSEIDKFVMGVQSGAIKPFGHFLDDGWVDEKKSVDGSSGLVALQKQVPVFKLPAARQSRFKTPDVVLKGVCKLTGKALSELKTANRGRSANPARRFAVWALLCSTQCTHREVAELLKMSRHQVSNLICRLRNGKQGRDLAGWISEWEALENDI